MTSSEGMIGRALTYGKRHGFRAIVGRTSLAIKRWLTGAGMVLFACDLRTTTIPESKSCDAVIERRNSFEELEPIDLDRITAVWNPDIAKKLHGQRFNRGASLWLVKMDGRVAAYGWTIRQHTIEPHYFTLKPSDVHLFDFFVFPEYRGRRLNPALVNHILAQLAAENASRAFIEAAEWNTPQLESLRRTPFRKIGQARKSLFFGKTTITLAEAADQAEWK